MPHAAPLQSTVLGGDFVDLRPLTVADAELTLAWRRGQRARLLNAGSATVEQQAQWIAGRPDTEYNYVIELATSRHPIGMLSLIDVDLVHRRGETARFLIGDEAAAQGVPAAVEAMKLLYRLAFDELGLLRVWGTVVATNTLMVKWQKFLGMKEEGRLRQHLYLDGTFHDAVLLGLLAEEYRTITLRRMDVLMAAARTT
jgi:RimJ/RimL family protein N-acetyltransferase